jgi:hypothetical protein
MYLSALAANDDNVIQFQSAGSFAGGILIASSGQLRTQNASYGESSGGPVMPTGAWFRLEWYVVCGAAGAASLTVNYYSSPDSTTVTGSTSDAAGQFGAGGVITEVDWGWTSGHASMPSTYFDSIGLSVTGYLGPDVIAAPPPQTFTAPSLAAIQAACW